MKPDSTEKPPLSAHDDTDPEIVRRAIRARAEEIKRRELQRAFDRLEARGTLTPEQRRTITQTATAIVDRILAAPESTLADASEYDSGTLRVAVDLFDRDRNRDR